MGLRRDRTGVENQRGGCVVQEEVVPLDRRADRARQRGPPYLDALRLRVPLDFVGDFVVSDNHRAAPPVVFVFRQCAAWGLAWEGGLAITGEQHPRWVEGASAILYPDTSHAPAMAAKQGVRAVDLLAHGIVDNVIPEYPDAAAEPEPFCLRVGATLRDELAALVNADTPRRLTERVQRLDRIGQPDPVLAQAG
jgi:hypothetical protein